MDEIWKDVVGYEGIYQVSDTGKVRRVGARRRNWVKKEVPYLLHKGRTKTGYEVVVLWAGKQKISRNVHGLVAEAFLGTRPENTEINHKNGMGYDNRVENLEYISHAENSRHAVMVLGHNRRQDVQKVNDDQVRELRQLFAGGGVTKTELAIRYGISRRTVREIISGRARAWVT